MDRTEALLILGVEEHASEAELQRIYAERRADLESRIARAPTPALQGKFQAALHELGSAHAFLQTGGPLDYGKGTHPLSHTKLADLPLAGPVSASADNAAGYLQPGSILLARFEIKEVVGRGGMGVVYRAFDRARGKEVALKQLHPALLRHPGARERFLNEARLSCELTQPSIVRVFDVPLDGDNVFVMMELLRGETLRAAMERRKRQSQPYKVAEVKVVLKPLCEALAYAHEHGAVHRDVKPENVWIGEDGSVKLMDFGIAKVLSASQLTQTGTAMGTAYYMAPEQLKSAAAVNGRADQYAVAVLAYELLSGDVPAGAIKPVHQLRRDVSRKLSNVLMKSLDPKPEQRYLDMLTFAHALLLDDKEVSKARTARVSVLRIVGALTLVFLLVIPPIYFGPRWLVNFGLKWFTFQGRWLADRATTMDCEAMPAANASCVVDRGDGLLRQPASGLDWTQSDNGQGIGWVEASRWCRSKGSRWRLPTEAELFSLGDEAGRISAPCGRAKCAVSPLFRLTSWRIWSGDPYHEGGGLYVYLTPGALDPYAKSGDADVRALCVRPS